MIGIIVQDASRGFRKLTRIKFQLTKIRVGRQLSFIGSPQRQGERLPPIIGFRVFLYFAVKILPPLSRRSLTKADSSRRSWRRRI